jgi:2-phosphosulfolactate phosphatase
MRVHIEWGATGAAALAPQCPVVVVCDVLSFSTTVSVAVAGGACIRPHPWKDASAAALAEQVGGLLAGARGSDVSLSPVSMRKVAAGTVVVLPSPNGAMCSLAAAGHGATVVAGCLRNAGAVARWCAARGVDVGLVAAGEQWPDGTLRPAYEDWIGAGLIAADLADIAQLSPEAEAAALASQRRRPLAEVASGVELVDAGFGEDVDAAEEIDADDVVPVLVDGQFGAAELSG